MPLLIKLVEWQLITHCCVKIPQASHPSEQFLYINECWPSHLSLCLYSLCVSANTQCLKQLRKWTFWGNGTILIHQSITPGLLNCGVLFFLQLMKLNKPVKLFLVSCKMKLCLVAVVVKTHTWEWHQVGWHSQVDEGTPPEPEGSFVDYQTTMVKFSKAIAITAQEMVSVPSLRTSACVW